MIQGIDLFASAGWLSLEMQAAGITTVCAVEINPYRTKSFASHTPKADIITSDIHSIEITTPSPACSGQVR